MRRRALLSIVSVVGLSGCNGRLGTDQPVETTRTQTKQTTTRQNESSLAVVRHDLVRLNEGSTNELATVTGVVRNPTDETIPEATVSVTFEAADGTVLERASASASDLTPGGSWTFQLVHPATGEAARKVSDYEVAVTVTN